jgi:DNA adenine methylase
LRQVDDVAGHDLLELGVAGLFFNRTNFSGVIHAGPIGGQSQGSDYAVDCRFNKQDLVKRICTAASYRDQIQVFFGDAVAALTDANNDENSNRFFYVDPPYYKQGKKLYRYHYSDTAHKQLAATLSSAHYDWILSYDHHHVIEHFYAGFKRITKSFRYSSRVAKQEKELLITNIEGWIDGLQCKLAFDDEAKLLGGKMLASKAPELELDAVS